MRALKGDVECSHLSDQFQRLNGVKAGEDVCLFSGGFYYIF
jgi:hypothetical protein